MKSSKRTIYPCCCGQHHEALPSVALQIEAYGRNVRTRTRRGSWYIPRIFLAVHGMPDDEELQPLAWEYGWRRV